MTLVVKRSESGDMGSITARCWNSLQGQTQCRPLAILSGTEPVSALTCAPLNCYTLSIFWAPETGRWRSRADRVSRWTLNVNIWFGAFGVGPGPGLSQMCGSGAWAVIIAIVYYYDSLRASAWEGLAIVFLELSKILKTQWPTLRVFNPKPLDYLVWPTR